MAGALRRAPLCHVNSLLGDQRPVLVGGEVGLDSSAPAFTGIPPHIELSTTFLRMVGDAEPTVTGMHDWHGGWKLGN
jgi:hypothetical protein